MNLHHIARNNSYLLIIIFALLSCTNIQTKPLTPTSTPLTTANEIEVVFTPTPEEVFDAISPVPGETPYPFSLEDVTCQFEGFTIEPDVEHWTDSLIPGTSTIDDLAAIHKITEEPQWEGHWRYSFGSSRFNFNDGILQDRNDVRTKLEKIISHYGYPEKIMWEIPNLRSFDIAPLTIFLYPNDNAYFYTTGIITELHPEIEMFSLIFTQEGFQSMLSEKKSSEKIKYDYFYLDWPCQQN